ncbi:MAG: hypothetical protein AB8H79_01455 [Myxococcota bacterium]
MRAVALIVLSLTVAPTAWAQSDCEAEFSVNQFVQNMNKADGALAEFDLDMYRNVLDLTYAQLPCTRDPLHPNHIARFGRQNALAAFFDQDELTVEFWGYVAQQKSEVSWPDDMGEDHPFRMTLAEYSELTYGSPDGAFLYPPKGGAVFVNGWLVEEPRALVGAPNLVQVLDKDGLVMDTFWIDGPTFPDKVLRGDDGGVATPSWYTEPDLSLDPRAEVKVDPKELARRESLAAERQAEKAAEEVRLKALQASAAKAAEKQAKKQAKLALKADRKEAKQRARAERRGEVLMTDGAPPPPPETWVQIDVAKSEGFSGLEAFETEDVDIDCGDLISLEPKALLGRLSEDEVTCLERSLRHSGRQVERDKVSRVLVADAYAKGKMHRWEAAMRRHLTDIDRSDADLCYIFARHLARQGPDRSIETIRWTELALTNKGKWSGPLRRDRVYALMRLRAIAAQQRWYQAEKHYLQDPSRTRQDLAIKWRNRTKTMAREWLDYSLDDEVKLDSALAFQICFSAAGTQDFCDPQVQL